MDDRWDCDDWSEVIVWFSLARRVKCTPRPLSAFQRLIRSPHLWDRNSVRNILGSRSLHRVRRSDSLSPAIFGIPHTRNISCAKLGPCWSFAPQQKRRIHIEGIRIRRWSCCHRMHDHRDWRRKNVKDQKSWNKWIGLNLLGHCLFSRSRHQGGSVTIAESLGSEELSVARSAMDFLVGSIACKGRVQRTTTLRAAEALLVPNGSLGQLLFGGEHSSATAWASFASRRLDWCCISGGEWLGVCNLLISVDLYLLLI